MTKEEYLEEIDKVRETISEMERNLKMFDEPEFPIGTRVKLTWANGVIQTGCVVDIEVARDIRTGKFYQYPKVKLDKNSGGGIYANTWLYNPSSNGTLEIEKIEN